MKTKNSNILSLLILFLVFTNQAASAATDTRYVSSINAKLLDQPSFKGGLIKNLGKGTQLTIFNKKGTWLNVKTDDASTGWVSKFLTKSKPPTNRATVLTGEKNKQLKNVHRRTSAITTAAAARGLASKASASTSDVQVDLKAVRYMESFEISNAQLNQFAKPVQGESE